jgi:putative transposase
VPARAQLIREGEQAGRDRVARLMRQAGVQGAKRRGKPWRTTIADPDAHRRPDLVKRDFAAEAPDRLWVGDFTYLRTWEGRSFFAFVIDVFSRMIVGWQIARHMRTSLVLDALRMALAIRQPGADSELVSHTDQGSPSTPVRTTPSSSTTRRCWRPSAASATATTTRSPNRSSTATRPS